MMYYRVSGNFVCLAISGPLEPAAVFFRIHVTHDDTSDLHCVYHPHRTTLRLYLSSLSPFSIDSNSLHRAGGAALTVGLKKRSGVEKLKLRLALWESDPDTASHSSFESQLGCGSGVELGLS
jgi:hypothetical protein